MNAISQKEIIALISDINVFADGAEQLIATTQQNYDRDRALLLTRHKSALSSLESTYKANCNAVNTKSSQTIAEARAILSEIERLDTKLSSVDKYYVKTKKKKEGLLSDTMSENYTGATDYFEALAQIKSRFSVLFKKYSGDILPGLINGLNYLFSSQRKKDYEDLIILRNTVMAFVNEIEKELPPITDEQLASLKESFFTQRGSMVERQRSELNSFESKHSATLDKIADKIWTQLDAILPDEFVSYLHEIIVAYHQSLGKVNATTMVQHEVLNMCFVDYPINLMVQSKIVATIIKDKCFSLLVNDSIRLPIIMSTSDAPTWMVMSDHNNTTVIQAFSHSIMYGMLSSCPVAYMSFIIVDPENRGNSISPYFDAKKKLPDLFDGKIYISKDDVSAIIGRLNEFIETTLQDKLGTQFDSVFDYAKDNPDYSVNAKFLILYDFPRGFDDHTLAALRNVLRNGSKCGIYTLILYTPDKETSLSRESQQSLQSIMELSYMIGQNGSEFAYRGLPLTMYPMPEKTGFAKFFSKYMLIYEGIKNRGIAFSPLIKKLVDACDSVELDKHIDFIVSMMKDYEKYYGIVPDIRAEFPTSVTLGTVLYPADVFSDSLGFQHILDTFGVEHEGRLESTSYVELPLSFDLRNSFNLLLNCSESSHTAMLSFTHHVVWSFLSTMPVGKVNVCVFDGEQRGNSIVPFLDFRKRSPDTFDQKIYTSQEAMYERLLKINLQIDEFIQDKLGNRFRNIFDYNIHTPNRTEAVTLLVIYDFPSGMDARSMDLLTNILRNGNRCGVFIIICYNPNIIVSRYDNIDSRLEQIGKYCASLDFKDSQYCLLPYNLGISIPEMLSADTIDYFTSEYLAKVEAIKKQGLSFRDIISKELFSMDSSVSLSIPVGVGDGDSIISIVIGEGSSHHGLIAGATGSGKSTLLHTLIMSAMLHYSPEQLHLYLMDFKSGTEFKVYESVRLPHIQLLALDAMQEFGESILENLVEEMEQRAKSFKDDAGGVTKIKDYVSVTGKAMPRILVVMDEFQILFNDASNRKVAMHCAELTKRLVTEGRAFGIHLLIATQSTKVISDLTLSRGTIEQMRIRVGLKCGKDDARYLFSDQNDTKALSMMKGPIGTAVMNLDYTEQANIGFRAAYCDDSMQKDFLDLISKTFADRSYSLQTFEGSRTTRLIDFFASQNIRATDDLPIMIHMGDLIKVANPFTISIDKKKKHNLLVCGTNECMVNTVVHNYIISVLLNKNASIFCVDGEKLVGDDTSDGFYRVLSNQTSVFKVAEDRGDIIRFINDVYKKYLSRKKQNGDEVVFVVIKNLQFIDIIRAMLKGEAIDESEYVDENEVSVPAAEAAANPFAAVTSFFDNRGNDDGLSVGEKLKKLIEDGSGFGIHFIVSSLEYQVVRECMYYGDNLLSKFPERVIFSLGANDADNLIENVSVSSLRENTVYFTDGVKNTFQMKPYITPTNKELSDFFATVL